MKTATNATAPKPKARKTKSASTHPGAPILIGLDDGYADTKVAMPDGRLVVVPSTARRGRLRKTWLGDAEPTAAEYETEEEIWSVGDVAAISTLFDEFPSSTHNRVIVQHALVAAGLAGRTVQCAAGLPVSAFYRADGERRREATDVKLASLTVPVNRADRSQPAAITFCTVIPEALAAWYDFVIEENGREADAASDQIAATTAVIDIGGRTTDFVVVADQAIDHQRSGSMPVGLLSIAEEISEFLSDRYGLTSLHRAQTERIIAEGTARIFGKDQAVELPLESIKRRLLGQIRDECRRKLGTGAALDHVLFVGGGAAALTDGLIGWFPQQIIAPAPGFANARGMRKFMQHVCEIPNSSVVTAAQ